MDEESRRILLLVRLAGIGPPVRHVDRLSDEELCAIELDENTECEALIIYEATKVRLAEIRQVEAKLKAEEAAISGTTGTPKSRPLSRAKV
jgi:hypothetical protein